MNLSDLHLDPKRFQYKLNTDAGGATDKLKDAKWNQDLAKAITTWIDPADGKMYVVNGHHRYDLASRSGAKSMKVDVLGPAMRSPDQARMTGAIENLADNTGTATDAAKFMRDSGLTGDEIREKYGLSPSGTIMAGGTALAKLNDTLFDQVVNGRMKENRGIAIGNAAETPAQQEALVKLITDREAKGRPVTNETIEEMGRMARSAGERTVMQDSLFGTQEQTHSLALEKAEISSYIRKRISAEKSIFGSLTKESKADTLSTAGNKINTSANKLRKADAEQAGELYDRLSTRSGDIDGLLNKAAEELANAKGNGTEVKSRTYEAIRSALRTSLGRGQDASAVRDGAQVP